MINSFDSLLRHYSQGWVNNVVTELDAVLVQDDDVHRGDESVVTVSGHSGTSITGAGSGEASSCAEKLDISDYYGTADVEVQTVDMILPENCNNMIDRLEGIRLACSNDVVAPGGTCELELACELETARMSHEDFRSKAVTADIQIRKMAISAQRQHEELIKDMEQFKKMQKENTTMRELVRHLRGDGLPVENAVLDTDNGEKKREDKKKTKTKKTHD
eukprot:TRINITY_DN35125_c0_g2_i1.p1 TRINITY_DN35125_c0_g2~~TRINITY_DN35125_c0_g2_i1.p1  ORF type:complete len:218 (+),score=62.18 TRINITY_DN35125_c0_g2_i1:138-791(+)